MANSTLKINGNIYITSNSKPKEDDIVIDTTTNYIYRTRNGQHISPTLVKVIKTNDTFIGSYPSVTFDINL